MKNLHYLLLVFVSLLILFIFHPFLHSIFAQEVKGWGISNTYKISDSSAIEGDVMAIKDEDGTFIRASGQKDEHVFGVIVNTPVAVVRSDPSFFPIVREGDVIINVTTVNGPISPGDAIVVSPIPGKAQKTGEGGGDSIGTALSAFAVGEGTQETYNGTQIWSGTIQIALKVGSSKNEAVSSGGFVSQLQELLTIIINTLKKGEDVTRILRFLIAGLVAGITVWMSFTLFGRNISKGVEAIGRNPLAKLSIQSMIVVNIILIAIVTIGGVILTLVLIKF
jgi:hypothetical protein